MFAELLQALVELLQALAELYVECLGEITIRMTVLLKYLDCAFI